MQEYLSIGKLYKLSRCQICNKTSQQICTVISLEPITTHRRSKTWINKNVKLLRVSVHNAKVYLRFLSSSLFMNFSPECWNPATSTANSDSRKVNPTRNQILRAGFESLGLKMPKLLFLSDFSKSDHPATPVWRTIKR